MVEVIGPTGAAAERRLVTTLRARAAPAGDELTGRTRLADLALAWLRQVDNSDLAINTKQRYRDVVTDHVIPGVGGLAIEECTVGRMERFLGAVATNTGAPTAKLCKSTLSGMFALATRHEAAPRNLIRDVTIPASDKKPVRALTVPEVHTLRAKIHADRKAVRADLPDLVDLMLATGARIGEILAIRRSDVTLTEGKVPTVLIAGTIVRVKGRGLILQPHPKNSTSRRRLRLPAFAADVLRRRLTTVPLNSWDVLFPSGVGTLRDPTNMRTQWRKARDRAGFDWVVPHTFRKTVATLLDERHDLRTAADQLGHAGTETTRRHYVPQTHQGPDVRKALDALAPRRQQQVRQQPPRGR